MNRRNCTFDFQGLVVILGILLEFSYHGLCEIYIPIIWTPSNPEFRSSGTPANSTHFSKNVLPMSTQNIICPNPVLNPAKTQRITPQDRSFENLWIVDKNSFDSCNVDRTIKTNKMLLKCSGNSLQLEHYSLVFRSFSATSDILEFQRGKHYYFIATSNGRKSSLTSTSGGHCKTDNMKMEIYVCNSATDPVCNPTTPPPPTRVTTATTTVSTTRSTTRTRNSTKATTTSTPSTIPTTPEVAHAPVETLPLEEKTESTEMKPSGKKVEEPEQPKPRASKGARCSRDPEETTWLILVAVMGAIIAVSVSCNIYVLCCKKAQTTHTNSDDKRSSAAHALLRDNSRVDKV